MRDSEDLQREEGPEVGKLEDVANQAPPFVFRSHSVRTRYPIK